MIHLHRSVRRDLVALVVFGGWALGVGYHEVRDVVGRLREATPGATDRQLHDVVLSHGTPPPRHLRALLDV